MSKVITTITNEGVDKDEIVEGGKVATVTVLVTPEQAELLAHYNSVTTIHFTLVYRGETDITVWACPMSFRMQL